MPHHELPVASDDHVNAQDLHRHLVHREPIVVSDMA
jgi:hypothetical protein